MIRAFEPADREAVVAVWQAVFPDDPPHNEPRAVLAAKLVMNDGLLFVAEAGGEVIGTVMAGYDGHRGWLYSVAVLPEHRRAGLGRALVQHAVEALRAVGCIKVNLQVRDTNTPVIAFYESIGFATEARVSMGMKLFE